MVELGYGIAYRVLDAQYFGVAQRRRRVFVVGYLGDWRRAAAVLFERHSLQGHPPPRREAGKGIAGTLGGSSQSGGFRTTDLDNNGAFIPVIAKTLLSFGHAANPLDETLLPMAFTTEQTPKYNNDCALTLTKQSPTGGGQPQAVATAAAVRRLTPRECERLQGFPDDYTLVPYRGKPAADGPRYKALGNSMAVPVMRWIGERIAASERRHAA
jgi:DNA (cytosine-5)-methyltransferase 1